MGKEKKCSDEEEIDETEDEKVQRLIFSDKVAVNIHSFVDDRQPYKKESPPPKYLSDD